MNAFFFCGRPGGTPNAPLKKVCEAYLAERNEKTRKNLIAELERVAKQPAAENIGTLMNNQADIAEVLLRKDYL